MKIVSIFGEENHLKIHLKIKDMASFDAVNEIDIQEVDNAINNTLKEIQNRYDFKGSVTEVNFDRKNKVISLLAADGMKLKAVREMLVTNFVKRKLSPKVLEFGDEEGTSQGAVKMSVSLKEGIDRDTAKKMVKMVKDSKMKLQASVHEDKVRVTGKKIDDLQAAMALFREGKLPVPVQFVNMKS